MVTADDGTLVRQCLAGDDRAFEALVQRHEKAVFNVTLRIAGDYEDAKDLTQTAFVKAFENLERYDPRHKFYSWVYRIAINASLNFVKKRGRFTPMTAIHEPQHAPEDSFAREELSHTVQSALTRLKPAHRAVIVLRHFLDCSYDDIGTILQIPEKTVKSRLFTARQHLKNELLGRGVSS